MPYAKEIEELLSQLAKARGSLGRDAEAGEFHQLSLAFNKLGHHLREQIQGETAGKMQAVIRKLEADEPIDADDRGLIRLWMVSDAEYYVRMENDVRDWINELERILEQLQRLQADKPNLETIGKMAGSVRDGLRVIADIAFFKEQEDRVRRFEDAMQRLQREDRRSIARILRNKLISDKA